MQKQMKKEKNKSQTDWNFPRSQCSHNLTEELCLLLLTLVVDRSAVIVVIGGFQAKTNINGLQIAPPARKPSLHDAVAGILFFLENAITFNWSWGWSWCWCWRWSWSRRWWCWGWSWTVHSCSDVHGFIGNATCVLPHWKTDEALLTP